MNDYIDLIKQSAKLSSEILLEASKGDNISRGSFVIKANELNRENWLTSDITKEGSLYAGLFSSLKVFKSKPVLYIFEFENYLDHNIIIEAIKNYKSDRAFPAFSDHRINNSGHRVLYVGKVKRDFWGRIIQHMGYFSTSSTQGLQLAHWACAIGLDLKVSYFVFDEKLADLMSALEYQLAQNLKPLLGKHK